MTEATVGDAFFYVGNVRPLPAGRHGSRREGHGDLSKSDVPVLSPQNLVASFHTSVTCLGPEASGLMPFIHLAP